MKINYSNATVLTSKEIPSIFFAGPTPRSGDVAGWRKQALGILEQAGFEGIVYIPEHSSGITETDYFNQVFWEREALYNASVILFWIPRSFPDMPAFTTNVEFGYWVAKNPDKVLYGRPEGAEKTRYLDCLYEEETGQKPLSDLKALLREAVFLAQLRI